LFVRSASFLAKAADMEKKELRKEVRFRKKQHTDAELKALSQPIMRKLLELSCIREASVVMMYCALPDEVYTLDAIHQLKAEGKRVVLPVVTGETTMELREYESDADLHIGSFNIPEPCGRLFADYDKIDVVVAPGMGFDRCGNRMGRGKGYYDRFLQQVPGARKVGVCFPFQKFDSIPADEHDVAMEMVISG